MTDKIINMMLEKWADHRANAEIASADTEYLRIRRDRWEQEDHSYRILIGTWLANKAIMEYEVNKGLGTGQ